MIEPLIETAGLLGQWEIRRQADLPAPRRFADARLPLLQGFKAVLGWLRDRLPQRPAQDIQDAERRRRHAFWVAGVFDTSTVGRLKDSLADATDRGESAQDWARRANQIADAAGISRLAPHHANLVYRNSLQSGFSAGKERGIRDPDLGQGRFSHVQYVTMDDTQVRPTHARMHGEVWTIDQFPRAWVPPNGHGCRCDVVYIPRDEAILMGLVPSGPLPDTITDPITGRTYDLVPDPGWIGPPEQLEA